MGEKIGEKNLRIAIISASRFFLHKIKLSYPEFLTR